MEEEHQEVERRFELPAVPKFLDIQKVLMIEQNYLATGYEQVRVRKEVDGATISYTLTLKQGQGLSRTEKEIPIAGNTYQQLLNNCNGKPLNKARLIVRENGKKFEIDQIWEKDLIIAEVEFDNESQAQAFIPPKWFGVEVTKKSEYSSMNLWKSINGLEEDLD